MAKKIDYFVHFYSKDKLHEDILLAERTLINNLKRCEIFKHLRQEKLANIEKLKGILKELTDLNVKLKQQMPKVKVKLADVEIRRKEKPETMYDYSEELERLEHSITEIESKLKELDKG